MTPPSEMPRDISAATLTDGMLDVGDGHAIYWRCQGPLDAPAIVVLHGGPGGAMNLQWGELLDAASWRIVFFDQRGCGRSTPFGKLRHNDLPALVGDIERLRVHLGIERWAVFGGSWGTTLALAYGAAHADRCLGFLLRGIFLARAEDIAWFLWEVRRVFPDAHRAFLDAIEQAAGRRPASAADILAFAQAPLARHDAAGIRLAKAWSNYERSLSSVAPAPATPAPGNSSSADDPQADRAALSMAWLERHYMADALPPVPPLLPGVARIAHLPCHIVHGRFDMVCPANQADALAHAWPRAVLTLADASGHATFEPGIASALRDAARQLRNAIGV